MTMDKAVIFDRDGVVNELVYYPEQGIVDSPFTIGQFRLAPAVGDSLRRARKLGYKLVVVSNQPGIAKKHFSEKTLASMDRKMNRLLAKEKVKLDGTYYCLHHPDAAIAKYRVNCDCRKPKPGLLVRAAEELGLSLDRSWMVGDGLTDVLAGKKAGCRTILVGNTNSLVYRLMNEMEAEPDFQARTLPEAVKIIEGAAAQTTR
jgi:D-glycero-D-manno-heptose 1,7-bisphosphate phosphatase